MLTVVRVLEGLKVVARMCSIAIAARVICRRNALYGGSFYFNLEQNNVLALYLMDQVALGAPVRWHFLLVHSNI